METRNIDLFARVGRKKEKKQLNDGQNYSIDHQVILTETL